MSKTGMKYKYIQVQIPEPVATETEQVMKRLGLSKQRIITMAMHSLNKLDNAAQLQIYGEILELFAEE